MPRTFEGETYLTAKEAAIYSGRGLTTIQQNWKKYGWDAMYFGRHLHFNKSQIRAWLSKPIFNAHLKQAETHAAQVA